MKKKELLELLLNATCTFTCTNYLKNILLKENFKEVKETEIWHLKEGKYFVTRNDASLIAFNIPKKATHFQIITTHNDTPSLLLKPKGENISENYLSVNIMPYGGLLNYGWLDHPLSIAGRIYIKKNNKIKKKIIDLKETLAVVPSVAIHLNDKANSSLDLNMQKDLQPILGLSKNEKDFEKISFDLSEYIKDMAIYIKQNPILTNCGKIVSLDVLENIEKKKKLEELKKLNENENNEDKKIDIEEKEEIKNPFRKFYKYSLDEKERVFIVINITDKKEEFDAKNFDIKEDISFDNIVDIKETIEILPYQLKVFKV